MSTIMCMPAQRLAEVRGTLTHAQLYNMLVNHWALYCGACQATHTNANALAKRVAQAVPDAERWRKASREGY